MMQHTRHQLLVPANDSESEGTDPADASISRDSIIIISTRSQKAAAGIQSGCADREMQIDSSRLASLEKASPANVEIRRTDPPLLSTEYRKSVAESVQAIPDEVLRLLTTSSPPEEILDQMVRISGLESDRIVQTLEDFIASESPEKKLTKRRTEPELNPESPVVRIAEAIFAGTHGHATEKMSACLFGSQASYVEHIFARYTFERLKSFVSRYFAEEYFSDQSRTEEILAEKPEGSARGKMKPPAGIPTYLSDLYKTPLLTVEQEQHLLRKFNYCKHEILQELKTINPDEFRYEDFLPALRWMNLAESVRGEVVQANLRLVVAVAKKFGTNGDEFFDRISHGNTGLIRAVDLFDFTRTYIDKKTNEEKRIRFSTYATQAINTAIVREYKKGAQYASRFRTQLLGAGEEYGSFLENATDQSGEVGETVTSQSPLPFQTIEQALFCLLDEREKKIIALRTGITTGKVVTLENTAKEISPEFGLVTKERIRQIETRALLKLRVTACAGRLPLEISSDGKPYLDPTVPVLERFNPALVQVAWNIVNDLQLQNRSMSIGELKAKNAPGLDNLIEEAIPLLEAKKIIKRYQNRGTVFKVTS